MKNKYNAEIFKKAFMQTVLYKKIIKNFPPDKYTTYYWTEVNSDQIITTPRELALTREIYLQSFYYLKFLLDKNPKHIYDIGCGSNFFKMFIPQIIGISPEPKDNDADINDFYDDDFVKGHQNYFESAFSINALHYRPISEFKKLVLDFMSIIRTGGFGYLALNVKMFMENTEDEERCRLFDTIKPSNQELTSCFEKLIEEIGIEKFKIIDLTINDEYQSNMNGNIHLLFEKDV